ncbi:MAG TPA: SPW repeat protein [Dongiaceae bacterium]|nr:SPW repeat protein [Dongiaceae bacterium]
MSSLFETRRLQDWINAVLGILLFISPWVLRYNAEPAASWTAWISGALIVALAAAALRAFAEWEEWLNLLLGLWVFLAPWLLGFTAVGAALWAHVALGLLVAFVAGWEIWQVWHRPHAAA